MTLLKEYALKLRKLFPEVTTIEVWTACSNYCRRGDAERAPCELLDVLSEDSAGVKIVEIPKDTRTMMKLYGLRLVQ